MVRRFLAYLGIASVFWAWLAGAAEADSVADFYAGKTVTMLVGTSAGGGYDLYARELAKYMGKYIPGQPTLVVQNMSGAGTMRATNYLYEVAPKDGSYIGTFSRSMPLAPLMQLPGVKFDPLKFIWLGSVTTDTWVCISWKDSPFKTWQDIFANEFKVGGEGKGSDPDVYATLVKNAFDAKVKLVTGYAGTAEIGLAMQRHELDGICGYSYTTLRATHGDWIAGKELNFIVQGGLEPDPDLKGVPFIIDQAKTDAQKAMLRLSLAPQAMARPFALPPGVPADRVAALRQAFEKTMTDPGFMADAKQLKIDINPISGAAMLATLQDIYKTSPEVVKQARVVMGY